MNLEYFIARKVAASGQQSFSRLILRIAIVAVALSIAVMIVSTALVSGFKKEISTKIFGFWGHIHITDTDINRSLLEAYPISKKQAFYPSLDTIQSVEYYAMPKFLGMPITSILGEERAKSWGFKKVITETNGGIRQIQTYALKPGIIKTEKEIEGIILKGVGKEHDWEFLKEYMVEGTAISFPDSGMSKDILISKQTADRLDLNVGDNFRVHFIEKGTEIKRRFTVSGIFNTGLGEYDKRFALVDNAQIQRLLGWSENEISGFEVFVDDIEDLPIMLDYIYYEKLPNDLYAESIENKLPELFQWLELQDINEVVILGLMIVVAIINMITALLILILERTNMIGILKAIGSSNWSIQKMFLYYAGYIVLLGLFWGNLIGIGLCVLQDQFGIIQLSEEDYYLSVAPIEFNFWTILFLNLGTLIITLLFLIIPSYLVTSISPVKAIRFK